MAETILATLPGETPRDQLLVVLMTSAGEPSRISMRQQSWGEGIGWYTQNTIDLGTHQVAGLRAAFGKSGTRCDSTPPSLPHNMPAKMFPAGLRIAQCESA